ncbi:hypothetical protein NMG60_11023831 [Bertholletia excelsa]
MATLACFGKKLQHLCSCGCTQFACFCKPTYFLRVHFIRYTIRRIKPFPAHVLYFATISSLGFLFLLCLKPRTESFKPRNLDLFFTSVSAATVSSMSVVEMEVFSNSQLIVMTVLILIGGEVFTSMVGLYLKNIKLQRKFRKARNKTNCSRSSLPVPSRTLDQIELGIVTKPDQEDTKSEPEEIRVQIEPAAHVELLNYNSIKFLSLVLLGYLLFTHVLGVASVSIYLAVISSAREVLKSKDLKPFTFSVFTVVSTFANCGFVPTNENMVVFSKNSGLLLLLIPHALLGNTLYPSCLRFSIWMPGKFVKKEESNYLLKNTTEVGYHHLLPSLHSSLLVATVFGFILIQFVLFCSLHWNLAGLEGFNAYQKVVGVLFQSVNARHAGETIIDISTVSAAILVLYVVMMYLPPYTSFLPVKEDEECLQKEKCEKSKKRRGKVMENLIFSQLSYLAIFIILVCITERKRIKEDPLNFNVLNIVVEVISAYGNVGFTTGYSCARQLKPDGSCHDKLYGFSGKWSDEGKTILIIVMFFGRLKKFNMEGGRAWKLL